MQSVRQAIGGLGNLMFKQAYLWAQFREGNIPDVYLQSERFFEKHKLEVRQMFGHNIVPRSIDKVAIHIRRGDYLKASQFHTQLWMTNYYKDAVKMFPDAKFLVFCKDNQDAELDKADREWCAEYLSSFLPSERFELYEHGKETDDLNTMASCKAIIAANSSFSWWAAYLSGHADVVFPRQDQWFTDGMVRCELLPDWKTLPIKYEYE